MSEKQTINLLTNAKWYDLTQSLSIFTPPWPGEMPLQVHFFKRLTGSWGGGQGANGELIEWSNNTGTHLVGPRAFHSGARAIADIPLTDLCGEGVIVDISDAVSDYSLYTPRNDYRPRAEVKEGDILIINTGYHKYGWDQPDTPNAGRPGRHREQGVRLLSAPSRAVAGILPVGAGHEAEAHRRRLRLRRTPDEHQSAHHARHASSKRRRPN
jgi:kynurenine formamidase